MPNSTKTKTKVATQTKVILAVGILLLLGLGAYGFGALPRIRRVAAPKLVTCGNGKLDIREVCDDGKNNGRVGYCNATCTGQTKEPMQPVNQPVNQPVEEAAAPQPVPGQLIVAVASDSPSGTTSGAAEQTIGKFDMWNTATSSIATTVRGANLLVAGDFRNDSDEGYISNLKLYKTSVSGVNLLASHRVFLSSTSTTQADLYFSDGSFSTEIAGGTIVPLVVTLDTSNAATDNSVSVRLKTLRWRDGVNDATYTKNVNLTAPTLNY